MFEKRWKSAKPERSPLQTPACAPEPLAKSKLGTLKASTLKELRNAIEKNR